MVSPYVTKLVKITGKSESEIEKLWVDAKKITSETLGKTEDQFSKREYDYAYGIVMNILGRKESVLNPEIFINSEKSAKEFLEDMISADLNLPNDPIVIKKKDDDEDEDKDNETADK